MNKHPHLPKLGLRFEQAFGFAAEKHATQTRKRTSVPYLSHLMSVAALVLEGYLKGGTPFAVNRNPLTL